MSIRKTNIATTAYFNIFNRLSASAWYRLFIKSTTAYCEKNIAKRKRAKHGSAHMLTINADKANETYNLILFNLFFILVAVNIIKQQARKYE